VSKLPEGRKPLPNEWFIDRAKIMQPEPKQEQKCVSCGGPSKDDFCEFCLKEE
jgi:hypothetical protein